MATAPALAAIAEIEHVKRECLEFLDGLQDFHPIADGAPYPETYRLLVLPVLYSMWERCFTLCHSIALRLIREACANPQAMKTSERAIWLIQAPFYQSLVAKLNSHTPGEASMKPKRGHFPALCDFLTELEAWFSAPVDSSVDTEALVMTFSNVNPEVVELNARAIGVWDSPSFEAIKFGRLNDLVGRRNEIGHGATIAAPPNHEFLELWDYTEELIEQYCNAVVSWITEHPRFQA
jgi:RiboL-PSP-HEPN